MAKRPVFIPGQLGNVLVDTKLIDLTWHPGFSVAQKQRSIASLHRNVSCSYGLERVLEISSKSPVELGVKLSAFNLEFTTQRCGLVMTVECAFQGSKVFAEGGPYKDIYKKSSRDAKKDCRLKESGPLVGFKFFNDAWPAQPLTAFYDWLYINALHSREDLRREILAYQAFTDIEFNPQKSINCQAYSAALYVSLIQREIYAGVASDPQLFLAFLKSTPIVSTNVDQIAQADLGL